MNARFLSEDDFKVLSKASYFGRDKVRWNEVYSGRKPKKSLLRFFTAMDPVVFGYLSQCEAERLFNLLLKSGYPQKYRRRKRSFTAREVAEHSARLRAKAAAKITAIREESKEAEAERRRLAALRKKRNAALINSSISYNL